MYKWAIGEQESCKTLLCLAHKTHSLVMMHSRTFGCKAWGYISSPKEANTQHPACSWAPFYFVFLLSVYCCENKFKRVRRSGAATWLPSFIHLQTHTHANIWVSILSWVRGEQASCNPLLCIAHKTHSSVLTQSCTFGCKAWGCIPSPRRTHAQHPGCSWTPFFSPFILLVHSWAYKCKWVSRSGASTWLSSFINPHTHLFNFGF